MAHRCYGAAWCECYYNFDGELVVICDDSPPSMSGEAAGADIIYVDGKVWLDRPAAYWTREVTEKPILPSAVDTGSTGVISRTLAPGRDDFWTAVKEFTRWRDSSLLPPSKLPTLEPAPTEMSTVEGRFCLRV